MNQEQWEKINQSCLLLSTDLTQMSLLSFGLIEEQEREDWSSLGMLFLHGLHRMSKDEFVKQAARGCPFGRKQLYFLWLANTKIQALHSLKEGQNAVLQTGARGLASLKIGALCAKQW